MKNLLFVFILSMSFVSTAFSTSLSSDCPQVMQASKQLSLWATRAINSQFSIGCPDDAANSAISRLNALSEDKGSCGEKAIISLLDFYAIFANHKNYRMCGLLEKQEIFLSKVAVDDKVCMNKPSSEITNCFLNVIQVIVDLKKRGQLKEAFELARKTADSNDVTGVSQMILGMMYDYGEGTNKNVPLAIKSLKEALEKIDDRGMRINILIALGVVHEELNDYESAKKYYIQCAVAGDEGCEKAVHKLKKQ